MKTIKRLIVICFLVAALFAAIIYVGVEGRRSTQDAEVEIEKGYGVAKIAQELAAKDVIRNPKVFELIARVKKVGKRLKAGTYEFPAGTTMLSALNKLARGDVKQYPVKIVEGWDIKDIAAMLKTLTFLPSQDIPTQFISLTHDSTFISKLGFVGLGSLEGYLFPDTYYVTKPLTAEGLIKRLTERLRETWKTLDDEAIKKSGMSQRQIITLASIVEKETGLASERPLIASVFFNRLEKGMPLQSDPTIIYGLPNYDGNIRKGDITNPHPYNTYVHKGLPPGPICSPGLASIDAVLHPATTSYLYFVSRNDGSHEFNQSLDDHNKAVRKYQLGQK